MTDYDRECLAGFAVEQGLTIGEVIGNDEKISDTALFRMYVVRQAVKDVWRSILTTI